MYAKLPKGVKATITKFYYTKPSSSSSSSSSTSSSGTGQSKSSTRSKASKRSRKRQFGGIIDEPIIGVGLHSGDNWSLGEAGDEMVVPMNEYNDGDGNINVLNIHIGNITKEADYLKLKPLVQRWMLEASSRRGMV